jgi:hypothetical protein
MQMPAPPHGDFRPDLLQDVCINHFHMPIYQICNLYFLTLRE